MLETLRVLPHRGTDGTPGVSWARGAPGFPARHSPAPVSCSCLPGIFAGEAGGCVRPSRKRVSERREAARGRQPPARPPASPAREELAGGTGPGCSWDCSVGLHLFVATSTSEMLSGKAAELLRVVVHVDWGQRRRLSKVPVLRETALVVGHVLLSCLLFFFIFFVLAVLQT